MTLFLILFLFLSLVQGKDLPSPRISPVTSLKVRLEAKINGAKTNKNHDTVFFPDDDLTFLYTVKSVYWDDQFPGNTVTPGEVNPNECIHVPYSNELFNAGSFAEVDPPQTIISLTRLRPVGVNDVVKPPARVKVSFTIQLTAFEKEKSGDVCVWEDGDNVKETKTFTVEPSNLPYYFVNNVLKTGTHELRVASNWAYVGARSLCPASNPNWEGCGVNVESGETLDISKETSSLPTGDKDFVTNTLRLKLGSSIYWSDLKLGSTGDYFDAQAALWVADDFQLAPGSVVVGVGDVSLFYRLPELDSSFDAQQFFINGSIYLASTLSNSFQLSSLTVFVLPSTGNTPLDSVNAELRRTENYFMRYSTNFYEYFVAVSPKNGPQTQPPTDNGTAGGGSASGNATGSSAGASQSAPPVTGAPSANLPPSPPPNGINGNTVEPPDSFLNTAPPWFLPVVGGSVGGTLLLVVCGVLCVFTQRKRRASKREHRSRSGTRGRAMTRRRTRRATTLTNNGRAPGAVVYPSQMQQNYPSAQSAGNEPMTRGYPSAQSMPDQTPTGTTGISFGSGKGTVPLSAPNKSATTEYGNLTLAAQDVNTNLEGDPYPEDGGPPLAEYPAVPQSSSNPVYPSQQRAHGVVKRRSSSRLHRRPSRAHDTLFMNDSGVLEPARDLPYNKLPKNFI